jgi:hypothetical protein
MIVVVIDRRPVNEIFQPGGVHLGTQIAQKVLGNKAPQFFSVFIVKAVQHAVISPGIDHRMVLSAIVVRIIMHNYRLGVQQTSQRPVIGHTDTHSINDRVGQVGIRVESGGVVCAKLVA